MYTKEQQAAATQKRNITLVRDLGIGIEYLQQETTYKQLGEKYGITSTRVGQIVARALRRARHPRYHTETGTPPESYPPTEALKNKDFWIKKLELVLEEVKK